MSKINDKEIIKQVLEGDISAFGKLIEKYHQKVLRYTHSHIGTYDEAEDAAQDVFVSALESLAKFRGEAEFSTWLYSITANYCKNYKKKKRLKDLSLIVSDDTNEEILITDNRQNTEKDLLENETIEIVKEEISMLADQYKEVLILRDIEGFSYDEISKISGLSLSNVKVRIHRGREMLMRRLTKRGIYE